jgi:hypothetical protein
LAKFIAGEAHCQWSLWLWSHSKNYAKRGSDFDFVTWTVDHAALVREALDSLRAEGYEVYVEEQNRLAMSGRSAKLLGKPDIIAINEKRILVIDCKTGVERPFHRVQVSIYMLMVPYTRPWTGKSVHGEVRYSNKAVGSGKTLGIGPDDLTADFQRFVWDGVQRAASEAPPPTTPSASECRFCDISGCTDRVEVEPEQEVDASHLF